ncbi:RAB geranylgeranyl transferase alpha subunit 1 [Artemisia annua]|uniref:Geranylgeranyl transferase type-2 subunit alpha n=1 Tax=Artemisia annua TaxID=35608 RepID=A0A2U1NW60_ARTAN|nr:RAB geranylgeranyl transferase alpha subunit 1 [Artemisia annua]
MVNKVEGYFPKENILKNEYDYVHNAVLPDPDNQSGWFYHLWLLDQTVRVDMPTLVSSSPPHGSNVNQSTFHVVLYFSEPVEEGQIIKRISLTDGNFCSIDTNSNRTALIKSYFESSSDFEDPVSSKWKSEMIASGIEHFRDALKWEERKIVKLTLARLLMACDAVKSTGSPKLANVEEVLQLYTILMKLDPPHNQYYKDEYSLVLFKQVTSSKESLLKYCWQYKDSTSSNITDCLCLRLNNLSLSRIGSFERLLWVQSLDLSHNQLHSIEGLEALQLLSCLNLRHNKLSSFMALDPLRFLKSSLKVLDISYNEIGVHTVDTRRYLCSSPMSHTLDYDTKFEEFANGDAKSVNFWDAYSIFGGLSLIQLDIVGNVAVDERFVQFLVKLMHGLKWLDGEELN